MVQLSWRGVAELNAERRKLDLAELSEAEAEGPEALAAWSLKQVHLGPCVGDMHSCLRYAVPRTFHAGRVEARRS